MKGKKERGEKSKKGKEGVFEFAWIFAAIIGALILFLAFYFVGTHLLEQRYERETIQAQSMEILLNPFAYLGSLGATSYSPLEIPEKAEIIVGCDINSINDFGYNEITMVVEKAAEPGLPKTAYDKYLYAPQPMKGKNFAVLSKPFEMPWRVADLIIIWPSTQEYCFSSVPSNVRNELEVFNISSIRFEGCSQNATRICFGSGSGCEVKVNVAAKTVEHVKKGKTVYYATDALMYAAIFSDPVLYNCNLKRLMARLGSETDIYEKKAVALSQKNCNAAYNLAPIRSATEAVFDNPGNLAQLEQAAKVLEGTNRISDCTLF
ncbi:MAG: hypothetical protein K6T16_00330 [Candidatus Pacearchaeota archaeon]|nr:hypothetical protein [Candidatus Pacearchaeota archaeon]